VDLNDSDDSNNELFCKYIIDDYKNNMRKFNFFEEIYLMVDLIFLKNISLFKIIGKYDINIYMMKNDVFIMHLKKDNSKIELITIKNEECENPLFGKSGDSETLELFEIEQFANNYINLLKLRQFIKKASDKSKEESFLFDFKGRINYILQFCKKVDNNNESNESCLVQMISVRDVNNYLIDKYPDKYIKDKNIIFVRETEFGKSFTKEELISILTYNFNIDISELKNRIIEKYNDKNLIIYKSILDEEKILTILIRYKSILPIFLMIDKKINNKCIQLIEYLYFLFLPLLIQEKSKPKVLIISDDYGILYNYYKAIYDNELDVLFASLKNKDEEKFTREIIIEKNNKKDINSYEDVFRIFNKKTLFDLIIVEQCFNVNEIETTTIPSVKNNFANLLSPNGIFSLNLRSSSIYSQNHSIKNLKNKFKNIKIINFRKCSDFLICSNNDKIQIIENFTEKYPKLLELDNSGVYLGLFIEEVEP